MVLSESVPCYSGNDLSRIALNFDWSLALPVVEGSELPQFPMLMLS